ncbi:MAG: hypothetical protein JW786_00990 [Desulfobacterales bacterium]|nr:hypothetical protein [Desulfobacterales bacterium]
MKTVLIATEKSFAPDARDAAVKIMKDAGLTVKVIEDYVNRQDLIEVLTEVNGLIVRSDMITKDIINAAPNLELIVRGGAGYDNIDHGYAEQKGIVVENTPGQNANAVAELAFKMMLRSIRRLNGKPGRELKGKKLAIHGFGNIGSIIARLGTAFGMDVHVYDKFLDKSKAKEYGVKTAENPQELYTDANVVSVHLPKNPETIKSIDYDLIKCMTEESTLVNTARAEVINEEDLLKILAERPGFKYATDVAPTPETKQKIIQMFNDRVIMTPKKQGAQTAEANYNTATAAAKQCVEFLINGVVLNAVNNPLPTEMKDFATLAQYLGQFNQAFIPTPNKIRVICYHQLYRYKEHFAKYVLKGLFQKELGKELTPDEALQAANERGIELEYRDPKNTVGHGDSITIDYWDDNKTYSVRGRVDEKELQINRVGEFKITIPVVPGLFIVVQYNETIGMSDRIGDALTVENYNKINGAFTQNQNGTKAMTFLRVERNSDEGKSLKDIIEKDIKTIPNVYRALVVDLR